MGARILVFPEQWQVRLAVARCLLGALCILVQRLSGAPLLSPSGLVCGLFTAYALVALLWRNTDRAGASMLTLYVDTLFFLAVTLYTPGPGLWLSTLFYVYLLLEAGLVHRWWDVGIVAGVSVAFCLISRTVQVEFLWRIVLVSGLLAGVLAFQKNKLEDRLLDAVRKMEDLWSRAEAVRQEERQKIAGDFHDGPLQSLVSLQMRLEFLRKLLDRDAAAAAGELRQLQDMARDQVREVRTFLRSMRPPDIDATDLLAAVRRVVDDFQKDSGITATFTGGDGVGGAVSQVSQDALQVIREALHNVQKHSEATRAAVTVSRSGSTLEITVDDNGRGFPFSGAYTLDELEALRLGPASIMRRVRSLGGDMRLESRPGHGAGMRIRIPA